MTGAQPSTVSGFSKFRTATSSTLRCISSLQDSHRCKGCRRGRLARMSARRAKSNSDCQRTPKLKMSQTVANCSMPSLNPLSNHRVVGTSVKAFTGELQEVAFRISSSITVFLRTKSRGNLTPVSPSISGAEAQSCSRLAMTWRKGTGAT